MKIQVLIDIKTEFPIFDTGYTQNMPLPEIERWAKDKMRSVQVLLKEGGLEPQPVRAEFTIREIRFEPENGAV